MNNKVKNSVTYKDSGVDIDAGDELVETIKPLAKSTRRKGADVDLGGFGGLFDLKPLKYKDPVLVSGTDGVGTKLKIAHAIDKHDTIGIDLVAMCVNDIVVQGAEPLFFLDYYATSKLEVSVAKEVIKGIADGCKQAGCALIGGETAEMPGLYQKGDYDLAGFAVGIVERKNILPKKNLKEGDIIIGLASSGVHSNGFSLVRYLIEKNNISYNEKVKLSGNKTVGELLLEPTKIYVRTCLEIIERTGVKAFAHITGGGLTENIPRVLPEGFAAEINCKSWKLPPLFSWLLNLGGMGERELLRTFNCGIGMIMVIDKKEQKKVEEILNRRKEKYSVIGKIIKNKTAEVIYKNVGSISG